MLDNSQPSPVSPSCVLSKPIDAVCAYKEKNVVAFLISFVGKLQINETSFFHEKEQSHYCLLHYFQQQKIQTSEILINFLDNIFFQSSFKQIVYIN
jgi:hypothetical protein